MAGGEVEEPVAARELVVGVDLVQADREVAMAVGVSTEVVGTAVVATALGEEGDLAPVGQEMEVAAPMVVGATVLATMAAHSGAGTVEVEWVLAAEGVTARAKGAVA